MINNLQSMFKDNCGFGLIANIKNRASHKNLQDAITALERMMHRGAVAADGKTGDGSGLLLSMPHDFMNKIAKKNSIELPSQYSVAMLFFKDESQIDKFSEICENNDLKMILQRDVPIDINALGEEAKKVCLKLDKFL